MPGPVLSGSACFNTRTYNQGSVSAGPCIPQTALILLLSNTCHHYIYNMMMMAVPDFCYYCTAILTLGLSCLFTVLFCHNKFSTVRTIPFLGFNLISGGFVNIIIIHSFLPFSKIKTQWSWVILIANGDIKLDYLLSIRSVLSAAKHPFWLHVYYILLINQSQ